MRLLVVEDDMKLSAVLRRGLQELGHVVDVAADGNDGDACSRRLAYDAIVLDVNLPHQDGLTVLRGLRADAVSTPVLILTSRDTPDDVVEGLDAGADDYLRKPFVFSELEARLRAIARREGRLPSESILCAGDVTFDLRSRRAFRGRRELVLTIRETIMLEFFLRRSGELVRREAVEHALFERGSEVSSNVLDVYASRIRSKLVAGGEPQILHTVRGYGFRFVPE